MESIKTKVQNVLNGDSKKAFSGLGQTVLVTGGSGYVAAHVLNEFLDHGYNVRTTVRSQASADKVKKSHGQYGEKLSFAIVPDITAAGAFDEAVKGVQGVIHTASPFVLSVKDNKRDLLDPAMKGTTSLLTSIDQYSPSIHRVVLTSSFAAIFNGANGLWPGHTYTEADWNPITYADASAPSVPAGMAYAASKALAEKLAWDHVAQHKPSWSLATICPPMIYGPAAHTIPSLSALNTSSADIYRLVSRASAPKTVPETQFFAFADVRDVALAHRLAFETPQAGGQRYFITGGQYTYQQICNVIRTAFPEKRTVTPEGNVGEAFPDVYQVDNGKARRELGMEFRGLKECITDMVREFVAIEKRDGVN